MGRQHQGMDRPGVRQVPEGSGEQGKIEKTGCKIIFGVPTTLAVKGLMMIMMMMSCQQYKSTENNGTLQLSTVLINRGQWYAAGINSINQQRTIVRCSCPQYRLTKNNGTLQLSTLSFNKKNGTQQLSTVSVNEEEWYATVVNSISQQRTYCGQL